VFVGEYEQEGYDIINLNGIQVYLSKSMVLDDRGIEISLGYKNNEQEFLVRGVLF
jgi:hypothetical protein